MKAQPDAKPDPWRYALDAVTANERAVLVMVVDHSGSVPGVTGTFVVVTGSGQAGTIGGGAAEHTLVEEARTHHGGPTLREFVHTESGDGTLCNGVQLFSIVPLERPDRRNIEKIIGTLHGGRIGTLKLDPNGIEFTEASDGKSGFTRHESEWSFSHPIGLLDTLTIIGGGHVALALSRVMATLPFRVSVIDNRDQLETMDHNRWAHDKTVVDYENIAEHVPEGDRSWVVVMTFGHAHDREVVERLLGGDYRYLGLMGSKAKIKHLFADMEAAGCDPAALGRVRAPIGVSIRSHTPEEIAVSVAAEIIGIRNGAID